MIKRLFLLFILSSSSELIFAQNFKIIPLGVMGGSHEDNLSAYMVAPDGQNQYVCLDAGTLHFAIQKAIDNHVFKGDAEQILRDSIKGYLISHGHLDHLAGLVLNAPDDSPKPIYAMPYIIDVFKKHYFSWESWANFANQGEKPALSKYHYVTLEKGKEIPLENTQMFMKPFPLSHGKPYESTAFLVRSKESYLLYLGDTGADRIEQSQKLDSLWKTVAPLIKSHQLKAIMIEVSFPNSQSEKQLFGHLTPNLLMEEMQHLSKYTGANALKNLNVVITHIKPFGNHIEEIKKEVKANNLLHLNIVFPEQGKEVIL
ncbi:3',5'-cyclic-nucleotide phosphodiesterase [Pedobacter psychrophilus]|uniref:3',5'-cyclic-nucleotide phosphodiesterase n=1 Tax=Pedobacter psychrophilus TaxID=1826909 RepID=A0A179DAA8_9SPHI|nr:3',5'-cyclic-nucleotide phosphodiesterase [Pedobacter psychrophilus]OAQ37986.1 3',5'-cyclic-nucleotide phosphodiesterase [Pedobacter psychrophilus]